MLQGKCRENKTYRACAGRDENTTDTGRQRHRQAGTPDTNCPLREEARSMTYTYNQAEAYINSIQKFTKKHPLSHTKEYLALLGNPCVHAKIVHVAGTNGKGSVCNYLRGLLMESGKKVGMFISPHLVTMRERMVINEAPVTEEAFLAAFCRVLETVETSGSDHPTFFEFLFLMAMVLFEEERPDYVILETGLGGRLDATNVFEKPVLTVITEIGLDHCQYLGDTKEQIAGEKAGIIKQGVPLVYVDREKSVSDVLSDVAKNRQSKTYPVDKTRFFDVNINDKTIDFSYNSRYYNNISFTLRTTAAYQAENAAAALTACELLLTKEELDVSGMRQALWHAFWPGRMEEIRPDVYLDGAHNADGIQAFLESVSAQRARQTGRKFVLLYSVVGDKDYEDMIDRIQTAGLFDEYVIACMHDARGLPGQQIRERFTKADPAHIHTCASVQEAYTAALEKKGDGVLYIAGSLYLVGEIRSLLKEELL